MGVTDQWEIPNLKKSLYRGDCREIQRQPCLFVLGRLQAPSPWLGPRLGSTMDREVVQGESLGPTFPDHSARVRAKPFTHSIPVNSPINP